MPRPTPFHPRTAELCTSLRWKDWAGYHAVCSFDTYHEREYFAFRFAAGLIDVTPLFKYDVRGPDAGAFLARIMVRDINKLKVGRVTYCCWCDERGYVLDDGTIWRLEDDFYRVTAAEPNLAWLTRHAVGFDVTIQDTSESIAALSLQGPQSRAILQQITDTDVAPLRFFGLCDAKINDAPAVITRTGYSGDLGYEIWVDNEHALTLWDALMEAGHPHGLLPAGLDAYDMCRVEAGFIMNGVDYFSANECLIDSRKSTPYDLDLGWSVNLERDPFIGQAALQAEVTRGPAWSFVGLEVDWDDLEALFKRHGLPPQICSSAWREAVPVYSSTGQQIGQATSGSWSPMLKKNLALATVRSGHEQTGSELRIETTVEYERHAIRAVVRDKPFWDPERKRS